MRIALGIEYCGARYHGWQTQTAADSVQQRLEKALGRIAGQPVPVVAAGRTDAGVHASGQVVHFDAPVERPDSAWVRGVNAFLPNDISIRWSRRVNSDFHARFSATSRRYRYFLLNRPTRPGVLSDRVGWDFHPLDVDAMANAARDLLGQHDFSSFRAAECQARTPVRTMTQVAVRRTGEFIVFDFAADAFLHHMVRNLVGALVYVGRGALPQDAVATLLGQRDRRRAPPTFMAAGLYLAGVAYPEQWALPAGSAVFPWESI